MSLDTNTAVWGIGLPLFLFFVAVAIGTVFAMTSSDSAGFLLAKAVAIAAAFDLIATAIYWVLATRQGLPWNIVFPGIAAAVAIPGLVLTLQWMADREIWLSTRLFPANLPNPSLPDGVQIPDGALKVLLGPTLAWARKMPHTILMMADDEMLKIDRDTDRNELNVSVLRIFDDRKNIIARIDEEGFWVENSTRRKRPDPSTLVVYDHSDKEVLRVSLLNSTTLSVTGIFRHPSLLNPVVVTPEALLIENNTWNVKVIGETLIADIAIKAHK